MKIEFEFGIWLVKDMWKLYKEVASGLREDGICDSKTTAHGSLANVKTKALALQI